jgi:hypothetical protein
VFYPNFFLGSERVSFCFLAPSFPQRGEAMATKTKILPELPSHLLDERGMSSAEFCAFARMSPTTFKRHRLRGTGPRLTWTSQRRFIIRPEHAREWLDARTDPPRDDAA